MWKKIILLILVLSFSLGAKQPVKDILLSKAVFQETYEWKNPGRKVYKLIPAKKVKKGAVLVYVNQIINTSKHVQKQIIIDNPIPYGTSYLRGSSSCEGICTMLYSIDGGKTYAESKDLFVVYGRKKRVAKGSEYTHIKYIFSKIPPLSKIRMAFKAVVK